MGDLWDGETTQIKSKRRVPRFRVSPTLPISVSIHPKLEKTFSAVSLSKRGLGFYGDPTDPDLPKLKNVDIQIKMDKFCIDLKASVQYCAKIQKPNGLWNYVGLQFVGVKPLLNNLLETFITDRLKRGQLFMS